MLSLNLCEFEFTYLGRRFFQLCRPKGATTKSFRMASASEFIKSKGPMGNLIKAAKENWLLTRFLLVGFLGYLAWHLTYTFYLRDHSLLDEYVIQSLVWMSENTMAALGWEVLELFEPGSFRNRLGLAGGAGLVVGTSCDGVALFALFAIFVMAYPGPSRHKLRFVPLGIGVVHLANYLRILGLMWIQRYFPEHLDFNHHYTFTVLVYAVIFWLWYLWAMKISAKSV